MADLMDGYPDIYDQLVDTDTLELRDRCRRAERALAEIDCLPAALDIGQERLSPGTWAAVKDARAANPDIVPRNRDRRTG